VTAKALERTLGLMAAATLFVLMALTFVDVLSRYFFNRPIPGSLEVTELLMVGLIFSSIPLVSGRGEHVAIDLLDPFLAAGFRRGSRVFIELLCAVALMILAWLLFTKAGKLREYGDETATLSIPIAPFVYGMSAAILVSALVHGARAFRRTPIS
jgi:TRAP-type transport system small permease protein